MKSLLFIALGVIAYSVLTRRQASMDNERGREVLQIANLHDIFLALERDVNALCVLQKKTLPEDEHLDPKYFHTRTPEKKVYLQ